MKVTALAAIAALALGGAAMAQHSHHGAQPPANPQALPDHQAGGDGDRQGRQAGSEAPSSPSVAGASPATAAFEAVNARMHKDMAMAFTGNPDVDFARGMIPHHQGAIDMARVVLEHGRDPEMETLAQGIIADQEKEIAEMEAWLKKHGG